MRCLPMAQPQVSHRIAGPGLSEEEAPILSLPSVPGM